MLCDKSGKDMGPDQSFCTSSPPRGPRRSRVGWLVGLLAIVVVAAAGIGGCAGVGGLHSATTTAISSGATVIVTVPTTQTTLATTTSLPVSSTTTSLPASSTTTTLPASSTTTTLPASSTTTSIAAQLPQLKWTAGGGATVTVDQTGILTVSSPAGFQVFHGVTASVAGLGSDYAFSGEAQLVSGQGYGFVVRGRVDSAGTLVGHGLQYDPGVGGYNDVEYKAGGPQSLKVLPGSLDANWHSIRVAVSGLKYTESVDGKILFTGTTSFTSGYLCVRVWNSSIVRLRNLVLTPLA